MAPTEPKKKLFAEGGYFVTNRLKTIKTPPIPVQFFFFMSGKNNSTQTTKLMSLNTLSGTTKAWQTINDSFQKKRTLSLFLFMKMNIN